MTKFDPTPALGRYYVRDYGGGSLTVMERLGCQQPDGTLTDRVVCDVPLYGDHKLDLQANETAEMILVAMNEKYGVTDGVTPVGDAE